MPDDQVLRPAGTEWQSMRLTERQPIAEDVFAVTLMSPTGAPIPAIAPGDHVEVRVPGGTRAYSLCNPPGVRDRYLLGIQRSSLTGGAQYLCQTCNVGDTVQVRGPRNCFALSPLAQRAVLVAGGIGITPIVTMAERLAAQGIDFEMHYSARSRAAAAFVNRLEGSAFRDRVRYYFRLDTQGGRLRLDALFEELDASTHIYLCGPAAMLTEAISLSERHSLTDRLHYERFGASDLTNASPAVDSSFDVLAARSGRRIHVPANCSIAAALTRAGIDVPLSCEQGYCGMCATRVLYGVPDHRDAALSPAERAANNVILPCVSRSRSALLTLDV